MLKFPGQAEREAATAAAFAEPRVGDIFHEMYSFGVQVLEVTDTAVHWREFGTAEIRRGWCTREEWRDKYRYTSQNVTGYTVDLLERAPKHRRELDSTEAAS